MTGRFARTAERLARLQDARADVLAARVRALLPSAPEARALDAGTGAGALAFALAPLVRQVVAVDVEPALLEEARRRAPANVQLLEADASALPFPDGLELRSLLAEHRLELRGVEVDSEERELEAYLDLAGCEGEPRDVARALAPRPYVAELGWYVLERG